jgi:hypothetical protein
MVCMMVIVCRTHLEEKEMHDGNIPQDLKLFFS